jgi:hypothetical protein
MASSLSLRVPDAAGARSDAKSVAHNSTVPLAQGAYVRPSAPAQGVEVVVIDAEMVRDLVHDGHPDVAGEIGLVPGQRA